jgi:simple sugar transport system permease protein
MKAFVNKADKDIINKWKVFWRSSSGKSLKTSLIAILAGIIFGFIILFIFHPLQSLSAIFEMILGPFRNGLRGFGDILYKAAPIILTGLAVGFAFKTGLFNIGAPGQFVVAGAVTVIVGQMSGINSNVHWIIALLAGTAAGAFWGLIPGLLKAFANVHEVVATIMMNYIGIHMASLLINRYAYRISGYASIKPSALLPKWGLDVIFQHPPMIDISILIAIVMSIIIWYVIDKTTFGFQLKAVGYNFEASRYAGINEKRNIVLSMVISGALAGIAGACLYLGGTKMTTAPILAGEGFAGITVALLASSNPIAIIFAGYFIAHISIGGSLIRVFGYQGEIASIVTASIVYFMGIGIMIQYFLTAIHRHREEKKKAKIKEGVH